MHEAIIAVSKNTADTPDKVGFMVSKNSTTAPDFNTIKDKSTFYTRDLVANINTDTPLNVYLSVNDKTPETATATSTGFTTVTGVRNGSLKLNNPEQFLEKNTEYTLYVYQLPNGEVIQTEKFTTIDYPTDAENGFYGTPKTVHTIGMKVSEKFMVGLLGKGLISDATVGIATTIIVFCEVDIRATCFISAEDTTYFVQQEPSNQHQEMLVYVEDSSKYSGTWKINDGNHSEKTLFILTKIEEAK